MFRIPFLRQGLAARLTQMLAQLRLLRGSHAFLSSVVEAELCPLTEGLEDPPPFLPTAGLESNTSFVL